MSDLLENFLHLEEQETRPTEVTTGQGLEEGEEIAATTTDAEEGAVPEQAPAPAVPKTPEELFNAVAEANLDYMFKMDTVDVYRKKLIAEKRNPNRETAAAGTPDPEFANTLNAARQTEALCKQLLSEAKVLLEQEENKNNEDLLLVVSVLEKDIITTQNAVTDIFTYSLPDNLLLLKMFDEEAMIDSLIQHHGLSDEEAAALRSNLEAQKAQAAQAETQANPSAEPNPETTDPNALTELITADPSAAEKLTFWQRTKLVLKAMGVATVENLVELGYDPELASLEDFLNLLLHGPQALNRGYRSRLNGEGNKDADGNIEVKSHEFKARFRDVGLTGESLKGCIAGFKENTNISGWVTSGDVEQKLHGLEDSKNPKVMVELLLSFEKYTERFTSDSQDNVWNDFNVLFTSQLFSKGEQKAKLNEEGMDWLKGSLADDAKELKRFWGIASGETKKDTQNTTATTAPVASASVPAPAPTPASAPPAQS